MAEDQILAARRLQTMSVRRMLTSEELQYGLWLVDHLISDGKTYAAGWVYDALRRSERAYREQGMLVAHARLAHDLIGIALGQPLSPARAPTEYTIQKLAPRARPAKVAPLKTLRGGSDGKKRDEATETK